MLLPHGGDQVVLGLVGQDAVAVDEPEETGQLPGLDPLLELDPDDAVPAAYVGEVVGGGRAAVDLLAAVMEGLLADVEPEGAVVAQKGGKPAVNLGHHLAGGGVLLGEKGVVLERGQEGGDKVPDPVQLLRIRTGANLLQKGVRQCLVVFAHSFSLIVFKREQRQPLVNHPTTDKNFFLVGSRKNRLAEHSKTAKSRTVTASHKDTESRAENSSPARWRFSPGKETRK